MLSIACILLSKSTSTVCSSSTIAASRACLLRAVSMRYTYHSEQWFPHPLGQVFAFFSNPENLPRLMPPAQRACIAKAVFVPPPPISEPTAFPSRKTTIAGAGTRLTLSFRPLPYSPIRISWETEISEFIWNDHFCDRLLHGPFAYWHHCHRTRSGGFAPTHREPSSTAPC
jgi:ligand-binding SRPBCC domain-containing protein